MARKITLEDKNDIVLAILSKEKSLAQICAEITGISEGEVQKWLLDFKQGGKRALRSRSVERFFSVLFLYIVPSLLVLAAVSLSIVTPILDYPLEGKWEEAAWKGDFWGGHLASGCTAAGVFLFFLAIMLQREELKSQREELELTRDEMRQSRGVAETQLQLARESAVVTQILECARLQFEAETSRDTTASDEAKVVAREHLARLDEVFEIMFSRYPLKRDLRGALLAMLGSEYGTEVRDGKA